MKTGKNGASSSFEDDFRFGNDPFNGQESLV